MKIRLPIADAEALAAHMKTARKMGMSCKVTNTRRLLHFELQYSDPIDLYWFGANVVAEGQGIFKTGITR